MSSNPCFCAKDAIREAKAETLREVLAELARGYGYRTGWEAAESYAKAKLSALTGGTEETS